MKRITIPPNHAGLVFKDALLKGVLTQGKHWLGFSKTIELHDMSVPFQPTQDLNILLQNIELAALLTVATISENEVGLVYKDGNFSHVLEIGKFAFWKSSTLYTVEKYNKSAVFSSPQKLNILLQNEVFAALLDVIEIGDNEIALLYKDGNIGQILGAGKFGLWKGTTVYTTVRADLNSLYVDEQIDKNLIEKGFLSTHIRLYRIEPFEKGILFVNGEMVRQLEPGNHYFWKNSDIVHIVKTDLRQMTIDLSGQEVLTKDKAQLRINMTVQYRVTDIYKALVENKEYDKQFYTQMQMALREIIGKLTFDELMESKDQIAAQVMAKSVEKSKDLGIELTHFGVKDIILPGDVKDIMNQVLIAEKRAQANVIMRREETASARSLMNTAKLMEENAMLLKLKEMEYVERIAEKIHTISLSGGGQIVDQLKQLFVK